jgi:predicted amidohydrolase YtcJ
MRRALGPERTGWAYRQRSLLAAGLVLPGSSDRPVVQGPPLLGIHDLVNQRTASGAPFTPVEALTGLEALRAYTVGSAYASGLEDRKGTLGLGKLADLTVLADSPADCDPSRIAQIEVLATMVGGEFGWQR